MVFDKSSPSPVARRYGLKLGAAVAVVVAHGIAERGVVLLRRIDFSAQKVVVAGTLCTGIGGGGIRTAGCAAPGAGSGIALLLIADGRLVLICEEGLEAPINTNSSDYSSSYARRDRQQTKWGGMERGSLLRGSATSRSSRLRRSFRSQARSWQKGCPRH